MAVDEEQKLGGSAECLSASAFLARYGSFGYIETGPGMKMSERATSKIKSPNSVIRTRSNSMKINAGDILKSPKNQEMDSRFFARFLLTPTDVTLFVACSSHSPLARSNRFCPTNRNRRNLLKTNDGKISNRGQNTH